MNSNELVIQHDEILDYKIYSEFINEYLIKNRFGNRPLVICSDTTIGYSNEPVQETVKKRFHEGELTDDLLDSFRRNNQISGVLKPEFDITSKYELVSKGELNSLFENKVGFDAELKYKTRFPNHVFPIYFSRIGYNHLKTRALFFFAHSFVETKYVVMALENGHWKIEINRQSSIV